MSFDNSAGTTSVSVKDTDTLKDILDDATVTAVPVLATGTGLIVSMIAGGTFTITGSIEPDTTATVTYEVRVNPDDAGNRQVANVWTASASSGPITCDASDPNCTVNPVDTVKVAPLISTTTPPASSDGLAFTGVAYLGQLLWYGLLLILVGLLIVSAGFRRKSTKNSPTNQHGSESSE